MYNYIHQTTKYIVMAKLQTSSENTDFDYVLSLLDVENLAFDTGFYQRSPQKITASSFMKGFWQMQQKGKNSLRNWGVQVGSIIQDSVRKQSIDNRLSESGVKLCKMVLKKALNTGVNQDWLSSKKQELGTVLSLFNRVVLEDSTLQKLPPNLHQHFGGNTSTGAQMRIQALFDFSSESWLDFSIDSYSKNDQSQAKWGFDKLEKRDLVIRDLGYFVLDALEELIENQYVITSYKPGVYLYDQEDKQLNLLELLKDKQQVNMPVLVGQKKKIPMRLVVRKLSNKQKKNELRKLKTKENLNPETNILLNIMSYLVTKYI